MFSHEKSVIVITSLILIWDLLFTFTEMERASTEHKKDATTPTESTKELSSIQYFSGNPSVERTQGVLHLFKDK